MEKSYICYALFGLADESPYRHTCTQMMNAIKLMLEAKKQKEILTFKLCFSLCLALLHLPCLYNLSVMIYVISIQKVLVVCSVG